MSLSRITLTHTHNAFVSYNNIDYCVVNISLRTGSEKRDHRFKYYFLINGCILVDIWIIGLQKI